MTNGEDLRVLIADDHPDFRAGLEALLRTSANLRVVGIAACGGEAVELAADLQPDVVLMDLDMPEGDGVESTARIVRTSPHIRVLMLSMSDDGHSVFAAIRAGAHGYMLKGAGREELLRAVRSVASGQALFGPAIAQRIVAHFRAGEGRSTDVFPGLTSRERDVLTLIAQGRSNPEIARQLFLSPKTIRNHISNIFAKLRVTDRSQAIVLAREHGLGQGEPSSRWQ